MNFKDIKAVALDCDGVLTDGIYQISGGVGGHHSIITKSFYTRDFDALSRIMRAGIAVIILTQSHDTVIQDQVNRICGHSTTWNDNLKSGFLQVWTTISSKKNVIKNYLSTKDDWSWDNIAYIGDAENDLESMEKSLWTGCPSDAIESVKEEANYISDFPGGKGAVYDFCMYILNKIEMENK